MRAFIEFCYITQHDIHDTHSLITLDDALWQFHHHHEILHTSGICSEGFNLPWQHSLIHYIKLIHAYGAPNGLCSSITESKHIKAIKEPWRCSSHFEALSQNASYQPAPQQACCCLGRFCWLQDATGHLPISSLGTNSLYMFLLTLIIPQTNLFVWS